MGTQATIHPFESRGLGKAPFRYVGIQHQEMSYGQRVIGSAGGVPITTKPGGTCAYCHAYIVNMFNVESADGQRFHVGCDCIRKVDGALAKLVDADVKKDKAAREAARIQQAKESHGDAHLLKSQPHPIAYHAADGKSLWDYAGWLLSNGGKSSQLRAARMIEAAISPRDDN